MKAVSFYGGLSSVLGPGRVLAVHRRSCTLETEAGELLTLAHPEMGNGPNAVLVAQGGWRVGERFYLGTTGIRFEEGPSVDWEGARQWAAADSAPQGPPVADHLPALAEALASSGVEEGLLPVVIGHGRPVHDRRFADRRGELPRRALADTALPLLEALPDPEAALGLVGLGPGATPSGDDLIAGLVLVLHYAKHPAAEPLRRIVPRARTTRLGRAMLQWAARGEAREHSLLLLRSLFSPRAPESLEPLSAVLRYGATSGADLAAGFLIGLQIVQRR